MKKRTKAIDFKTFFRVSDLSEYKRRPPSITAYSLVINPLAFLDIHFIIAAGAVVLVAVLERKLAQNGIVNVAAILSGVLHIGFPLVAFGAILILISKLGVFL